HQDTANTNVWSVIRLKLLIRMNHTRHGIGESKVENQRPIVRQRASSIREQVLSKTTVRVEPVKHRCRKHNELCSAAAEALQLLNRRGVVLRVASPLVIPLREWKRAPSADLDRAALVDQNEHGARRNNRLEVLGHKLAQLGLVLGAPGLPPAKGGTVNCVGFLGRRTFDMLKDAFREYCDVRTSNGDRPGEYRPGLVLI